MAAASIGQKMGMKATKKAVLKIVKKSSAQFSAFKDTTADFLRGIFRRLKIQRTDPPFYILGRIPHGFYENEMEGFFEQFGTIKRLRIARNRKTGKPKHFGFIEFDSPEVAQVVEECMHNYLMYEHLLQVCLVPAERVHPKLWKGVNRSYKPLDWVQIERKHHEKERTLEEQQKLFNRILKRDRKRQKCIEAAGIDYECPEMVGTFQAAPKKIRFDTE